MKTNSNTAQHAPWLSACAAASILMFVLLVFGASRLNSRRHYLSFGRNFHVALNGAGLSFYNDAKYGPYRGSVVGLAGNPDPQVRATNFPFYYRHFRWQRGYELWTLTIWLPWILLPLLVCPAVWVWQASRRAARQKPAVT